MAEGDTAPCAYQPRGQREDVQHCTRRAVIVWEAKSDEGYATAGSCADPRHAASVQAWVARHGKGPVRVVAGDLDAVLPDPEQYDLFNMGAA